MLPILSCLKHAFTTYYLSAIRHGLTAIIPVILIQALVILYHQLSWVIQTGDFQAADIAAGSNLLFYLLSSIYDLISTLLLVAISYSLALKHPTLRRHRITPLFVILVSLCCLTAWQYPMPFQTPMDFSESKRIANNSFYTIVIAITSTELFAWLASRRVLAATRQLAFIDPSISQVLRLLLPFMLTVLTFASTRLIIDIFDTSHGAKLVQGFIQWVLTLSDNPLITAQLSILLANSLWLCGLHGISILYTALDPAVLSAIGITPATAAVNSGLSNTFLETFALVGGSGSTLSLLIALCLAARKSPTFTLVKVSLPLALFNINEVLLFGLPILFNPVFIIPFLLVPLISITLTWLLIHTGLIPPITKALPWITPPFLNAYLSTGSLSAVLLQCINTAIGTAVYLPFVKRHEQQRQVLLDQTFQDFLHEIETAGCNTATNYLSRQDAIGNLARILAKDLQQALACQEFILEYQPQLNDTNQVIGVEALLRWPHKRYGRIPPPVIIAIAEESQLIHAIDRWVLEKSFQQHKQWKNEGIGNVKISVNVSALQLEATTLPDDIMSALSSAGLTYSAARNLQIEFTETAAVKNAATAKDILMQVQQLGVKIAIDDFGAGHTSLLYLKHFPINTLKIDRFLTRDVATDKNCQEIIASIVQLCASLNIEIITEFVETKEQRDVLRQLGCRQYQGWLYSPALPPDQAASYIRQQNC